MPAELAPKSGARESAAVRSRREARARCWACLSERGWSFFFFLRGEEGAERLEKKAGRQQSRRTNAGTSKCCCGSLSLSRPLLSSKVVSHPPAPGREEAILLPGHRWRRMRLEREQNCDAKIGERDDPQCSRRRGKKVCTCPNLPEDGFFFFACRKKRKRQSLRATRQRGSLPLTTSALTRHRILREGVSLNGEEINF